MGAPAAAGAPDLVHDLTFPYARRLSHGMADERGGYVLVNLEYE